MLQNMQKPCQGLSHTHQMATDIHVAREWKPRVGQNTFGTTQHTVRARFERSAARLLGRTAEGQETLMHTLQVEGWRH